MDDPTDLSASDWAKGVALSVLASVIGAGSKFCIRRSWLMLRDDGEGDGDGEDGSGDGPPAAAAAALRRRSLLLRGTGMVGMTFLNPLCSVLAMNYASPSILAPFSGLTLVWIVLLSGRLLGEDPTRPQLAAASLIVLGETVVAAFGDHTNEEGRTVADVVASYRDPAFLAYPPSMVAVNATICAMKQHGLGPSDVDAWMARVRRCALSYAARGDAARRVVDCGARLFRLACPDADADAEVAASTRRTPKARGAGDDRRSPDDVTADVAAERGEAMRDDDAAAA